jgi:SNF2 family DNA or RNA helicase
MNVINPEYLGSLSEFKTSFETPIMRQNDSEQIDILQRLIQPFVLRRLKTDKTIIQDLPDKIETKEYCNITTEQASLYQNVVDQMMEKIQSSDGIERKGLILTTLLKLKQVCDHPNLFLKENNIEKDRSGKIIRLLEMLEEVIESNEKALIFTQYVEMGKILQKIIANQFHQEVFFFSGETPQSERDRIAQLFQDTSDSKERESTKNTEYSKNSDQQTSSILILSLKAGGTGLNLTGANHVFHFDRWWNPAVENQATDRAFRIGQRKNVEVHKFICAGTLEERIDEMIEKKKTLAENIIGAGESWLTELTTDQLKDLFKLSREIITEDNENGN